MELQELKDKLKLADEEYRKTRFAIHKEYAFSHNKVGIDDVVFDGNKSVKVQKIRIHVDYEKAECVYEGVELNKDGSIKKKRGSDKIENAIYQRYLKQINGVNV